VPRLLRGAGVNGRGVRSARVPDRGRFTGRGARPAPGFGDAVGRRHEAGRERALLGPTRATPALERRHRQRVGPDSSVGEGERSVDGLGRVSGPERPAARGGARTTRASAARHVRGRGSRGRGGSATRRGRTRGRFAGGSRGFDRRARVRRPRFSGPAHAEAAASRLRPRRNRRTNGLRPARTVPTSASRARRAVPRALGRNGPVPGAAGRRRADPLAPDTGRKARVEPYRDRRGDGMPGSRRFGARVSWRGSWTKRAGRADRSRAAPDRRRSAVRSAHRCRTRGEVRVESPEPDRAWTPPHRRVRSRGDGSVGSQRRPDTCRIASPATGSGRRTQDDGRWSTAGRARSIANRSQPRRNRPPPKGASTARPRGRPSARA